MCGCVTQWIFIVGKLPGLSLLFHELLESREVHWEGALSKLDLDR
jgi:hypothetical protein